MINYIEWAQVSKILKDFKKHKLQKFGYYIEVTDIGQGYFQVKLYKDNDEDK